MTATGSDHAVVQLIDLLGRQKRADR